MDKKALLNELKIDRQAQAAKGRRPLRTFAAIAVVGGFAMGFWLYGVPLFASPELEVQTVAATAAPTTSAGDSVLDATGYVVARRQATVSSKTTGKVLEVLIEEGMAVEAGQLLAVLDDSIPRAHLALAESQLAAAQAALDEIRVQIRQAELDVQRTRNLAERNLASLADLDRDRLALEGLQARLERAGKDAEVSSRSLAVQRKLLEDMEIRAPFGGVVIAKAAQPGEMISPVSAGGGFTRTGICTIVDMDSLEIEVDVNEAYINRVHPRQRATARLNAYPDFEMPAEVIATIPAADRNKATVRVRIGFIERDARVLPDMGVKVSFLGAEQPGDATPAPASADAVLVPKAAVFEEDGVSFVWVVANGIAERREVALGDARGSRSRINHGLRSGERVVARVGAETTLALSDGASVTVAN